MARERVRYIQRKREGGGGERSTKNEREIQREKGFVDQQRKRERYREERAGGGDRQASDRRGLGLDLEIVHADRTTVVHSVKGCYLVHSHGRHVKNLGNFVHSSQRYPERRVHISHTHVPR